MTAKRHYREMYRLVDQHGVLHLARGSVAVAEAVLCGWPPVGNQLTDQAPPIYPPGAWTGAYDKVCDVCNERNSG